jgi:peroxiredoxin
LREQEAELERLDVEVAVVTFEAGVLARAYVEDTDLRWPLLVDEDRGVYRSFDMLAASFWDIWGPATWLAYGRLLLRGEKLVQSEGDTSQRGGNVLVDPDGIVRIHHVGDGPADRPAVPDMLATIRGG